MDKICSYWDVIAQFSNPVKILGFGILCAALATLVMIAILIIFRKKILTPGKYKVLRYLSISYMVLLPILSAFFGLKWGLLHGLQKDLSSHLPAYTEQVDYFFKTSVTNDVKQWPRYSTNEYADMLSETIYNSYLNTLNLGDSIGSRSEIISHVQSAISSKTISSYAKKSIHKLVKEKIGIDEDVTKEVMDIKMNELLNEGLFNRIGNIYIERIFGSLKNAVLWMFLIVLAFPVAEIAIAVCYSKKRIAI